jgi:hypothetical protein
VQNRRLQRRRTERESVSRGSCRSRPLSLEGSFQLVERYKLSIRAFQHLLRRRILALNLFPHLCQASGWFPVNL